MGKISGTETSEAPANHSAYGCLKPLEIIARGP